MYISTFPLVFNLNMWIKPKMPINHEITKINILNSKSACFIFIRCHKWSKMQKLLISNKFYTANVIYGRALEIKSFGDLKALAMSATGVSGWKFKSQQVVTQSLFEFISFVRPCVSHTVHSVCNSLSVVYLRCCSRIHGLPSLLLRTIVNVESFAPLQMRWKMNSFGSASLSLFMSTWIPSHYHHIAVVFACVLLYWTDRTNEKKKQLLHIYIHIYWNGCAPKCVRNCWWLWNQLTSAYKHRDRDRYEIPSHPPHLAHDKACTLSRTQCDSYTELYNLNESRCACVCARCGAVCTCYSVICMLKHSNKIQKVSKHKKYTCAS